MADLQSVAAIRVGQVNARLCSSPAAQLGQERSASTDCYPFG